jgi:hypothetical protein
MLQSKGLQGIPVFAQRVISEDLLISPSPILKGAAAIIEEMGWNWIYTKEI